MTIQAAKSIGEQGTFADKVWDVLLKLTVAAAGFMAAIVIDHASRLTATEGDVRQHERDIQRVEKTFQQFQTDLLSKMDKILTGVEGIGNRLTRVETKLEQPR